MKRTLIALAAVALAVPAMVGAKTPVYSANITESEVLAAQVAWCDALVSISKTHAAEGQAAAKALASEIIDKAYGYQMGPVLFKPTLAAPPQTFRTTREGAISYFVGGDPAFKQDSGFALKGWTACRAENAALHINGDVATSMGNVHVTDGDGKVTSVDKTWTFKKADDGSLRIVVHHSSLPFAAN
jgi:hypothetical protein